MKCFIYIDESGLFDEGIAVRPDKKTPSLVGGICTTLPPNRWENLFTACEESYRRKHRIWFRYKKHFHCSELRRNRPGFAPKGANREINIHFANNVFSIVSQSENYVFLFAAKNDSRKFEYSMQATYGVLLVAALRKAMDSLATQSLPVTALEIIIARRTTEETTERDRAMYHLDLISFIKAQLKEGEGAGVRFARDLLNLNALAITYEIAAEHPGLMAADFLCSFLRHNETGSTPVIFASSPEEVLFGDYRRFYKRQLQNLLDAKHYASAVEYLRRYRPFHEGREELESLVRVLKSETDSELLARELNALLAECDYLIHSRTTEFNALVSARLILESIIPLARANAKACTNVRIKQNWLDFLVAGLVSLSTCYNHIGAVGPQGEIEHEIEQLINQNTKLVSLSHVQRQELLLETKTKNLNLLFNDYRFEQVITSFEDAVVLRERQLPKKTTDQLLGKMYGSLGQAYAFLARVESIWSDAARDYFKLSLKHFEPGTYFHSMSLNFMATLAWQASDIDSACAMMGDHAQLPRIPKWEDFADNFDLYLTHPGANSFDAVNYARILGAVAEFRPVEKNKLMRVVEFWQSHLLPEHPHEQLTKWLAYVLYRAGEIDLAIDLCKKGTNFSRKLDFTVQTIGLSVLTLLCFCFAQNGDKLQHQSALRDFSTWAETLCSRCVPFAEYLNHFGGSVEIASVLANGQPNDAAKIMRLLPFTYA